MDKLEYIPGDLANQRDDRGHWSIRPLSALNLATLISYNDIKPIPLTPEILEKNGWYGATYSKQSDDNIKILYKTFKRKGYPTIKVSQDLKITCELSPFIVKLESVSDLQHLLFGLGINHEMEV